MTGYLLNLLYLALIAALSPYFLYAAVRKGKYRDGWSAKFLGRVPARSSDEQCIWLHAVSIGEVHLLAPIVDQFARQVPHVTIAISTTTRTGYEVASKMFSGHMVFYCPLDFTWATNAAMRRIRPDALVLAELELWPNLIRAAKRHGADVAVVNGRLSRHSFRGYRRIRPLVARLLQSIDCIAVQTETYADRFRLLGADDESIHVTGSVKYDGAESDRTNPKTTALRELAGFRASDIIFLAGSTQRGEEAGAVETFAALATRHPSLKLILVPRHPERFDEVAQLLDESGLPWQRRSALDHRSPRTDSRILLVDTVGELGAWWGMAAVGFVGGSLGSRGGQNMIEPAAYGAAVCFGPNTHNFRDVVAALLDRHASVVVTDATDLKEFVRRCLEERGYAARLGVKAAALVAENRGATERTVSLILERLGEMPSTLQRRPAA